MYPSLPFTASACLKHTRLLFMQWLFRIGTYDSQKLPAHDKKDCHVAYFGSHLTMDTMGEYLWA